MSWSNTTENWTLDAKREVAVPAGLRPRLTRQPHADSLLELAEELQGILIPVAPGSDYRRRLHGELVLRAQGRGAEQALSRLQQHRKGILIGAAAVGSVASVLGVIVAFLFRLRHNRVTHSAAGGLNPWR